MMIASNSIRLIFFATIGIIIRPVYGFDFNIIWQYVYSKIPPIGEILFIDANTNTVIVSTINNDIITLDEIDGTTKELNVEVKIQHYKIQSVEFELESNINGIITQTTTTATTAPYVLSNKQSDGTAYPAIIDQLTMTGEHTLTVSVKKHDNTIMQQQILSWIFVNQNDYIFGNIITGFTLINSNTNEEIRSMYKNDNINLASISTTNLNIRADIDPTKYDMINYVEFVYNSISITEQVPPYAVGGDNNGNYKSLPYITMPGMKKIIATVYLNDGNTETVEIQILVRPINDTPPEHKPPAPPLPPPVVRPIDESEEVSVLGELKKWHKITIAFWNGPNTSETATPNPFTDYRLDVNFTNTDGQNYIVPGYYAADGYAAETSATSGSVWYCHFSPPTTGNWIWQAQFISGPNVALQWPDQISGTRDGILDGLTGTFVIGETDKSGRDLRGKGLLQYVNKHHLQFAETKEWFLKTGSDSPENFLAYEDFDNTPNNGWYRKSWEPHKQDFNATANDPTWAGGKGTGIIGAINYLANQGMNAFSFLTFNVQGDDKNVFPHISNTERLRIDVSKTAQWEIVFEHGTKNGMFLHFKTQETENDQLLDGGNLGNERKLYYRELIARFGHHLALNWNLGEENTNTDQQRKDFADWFKAHDVYNHPVVIHTYIGDQSAVYGPLYGYENFDGASIQTQRENVFKDTLARVQESAAAGRPWIVANDEQGNAQTGVRPDSVDPLHDDIRIDVLWGNIMAGGAGCEYYFGYGFENSDLTCEDFRSRANMWKQSRYALDFFTNYGIPFQNMSNNNSLVSGNNWCLVENQPTSKIVIFLREGGSAEIDLSNLGMTSGIFNIDWFDPRNGGSLQKGSITTVEAGKVQSLGNSPNSPSKDWAVLLQLVQ